MSETLEYYRGQGMQPFDVIDAFGLDFYEGNIIKYVCRWRRKNGLEDLQKARVYLDRLIARAVLEVPISPEPSVEPAEAIAADVPDASPSGETQEEVLPPMPPPATPILSHQETVYGLVSESHADAVSVSFKPAEKPEENRPINQPGSSGAIYEARMYALSQIEKGQGIHTRIIANLTGWDAATVRKFVCEIQDEWKRRKDKKSAEVETGYISVVDILLAAQIEEEEEEEIIEPEPEPVAEKPSRGLPPWWSLDIAKYCPVCNLMIQPAYYEGCQKWEQKDAYLARKTCGMACSKKLRKGSVRQNPVNGFFREE